MNIKTKVSYILRNAIGSNINRKLIVFESDDWGSIRMPSLEAFERLKKEGLDLTAGDAERYNSTDTLASAQDLDSLLNVLSSVRDKNGRPALFTAMSVVANPDFDKIRASNFSEYFFEPFTDTLKRYEKIDAFDYWKKGMEERLFIPQFHGREHLNVAAWLRDLKNNERQTRKAFDEKLWGFSIGNKHYQAAFDLERHTDLAFQKTSLKTGLQLFKEIHGYKARFFVPPNGMFNNSLNETLSQQGIEFIGISKIQKEPQGDNVYKKKYHWLGQKNEFGQRYLTRNAFFEPNQPGTDWVSSCLRDIESAFSWGKPAVISTHRTNFIGSLDANNRDNSLKLLEILLKKIIAKWPEAEFASSVELGDLINES